MTARPAVIYAMDKNQGAAMRAQLDAMINVLTAGGADSIDETAAAGRDTTTARLVARLYEAREAASEIEMRPQPQIDPRTLTVPPMGVRFRRIR